MTANELRYNILLGVDSLFQGTAPGYNDRQMSSIINRAQRRVFRVKARMFDTDEKVKRMLAPLIRKASLVNSTVTYTVDATILDYPHTTSSLAATFLTLPSNAAYIVEEFVKLERTIDHVVGPPRVVFPITYDYFTKNSTNNHKKPWEKLVWRMDVNLENGDPVVEIIYPNTHTINDYYVAYLKNPVDIVVDTVAPVNMTNCEVTDQAFQDEIVAESIKIITASLNDEGYQVAGAEANFDEN